MQPLQEAAPRNIVALRAGGPPATHTQSCTATRRFKFPVHIVPHLLFAKPQERPFRLLCSTLLRFVQARGLLHANVAT